MVRTPKASEAEQEALDALRNLPWARLQRLQVAGLLYQTCRQSLEQHGESQVIWLLVSQILSKLSGSLYDARECRRLSRITTATQSIDRYAARLGSIIPEGRTQEHFKMLSKPRNQNTSNNQLDALRLLIFSVSNNFIMGSNNNGFYNYSHYLQHVLDDSQDVLRLFQATDTNDLSIMLRLIEAADTIPAISIFVKRLFDAAILLRCDEIAANILHTIHKDSLWTSVSSSPVWETDHTPLAMAVRHRSMQLTSLLLEGGANPNEPDSEIMPTPLENAAAIVSHDTAFELASLLVSHGAIVDSGSTTSTCALSFAVMRGNFRLIELLVGRGADFGQVSTKHVQPDFSHDILLPRSEIIDSISPEILAAGFCSTNESSKRIDQDKPERGFQLDSQARFVEDQEIACHMVRYMLGQVVLPTTSSLCPEKSRIHGTIHPSSMIIAAYRGYHDVIRILHSAGASVTALNSRGASPLSAAALRGDVGTCRLLMELNNAYEQPKEFDHEAPPSSFPTALQIAAWFDNEELCKELLAHGADPNGPEACRVGESRCYLQTWPGTDRYGLQKYAKTRGWNCLRMALLRKSEKVARCLLTHQHIHAPNQQDLLLAASLGDVGIMAKMLKTMRSPPSTRTKRLRAAPSFALGPRRWTHFLFGNEPEELMYSEDSKGDDLKSLTAIQVAAFDGTTNIVEFLLESGFELVGPEAAYAFRSGPKTLIQLILDRAPGSLHHKTSDGRSYLEMALLGGHRCLIEFALDLDSTYYDSGALCAAVMMGFEAETVRNLLRRRNCSLAGEDEEDNLLFNTALSLAASMCRRDLVQELLVVSLNARSDCCVAPDRPIRDFHGFGKEHTIEEIHKVLISKKWIGWHASVFRAVSPTFLAVIGQDEEILEDLLTAGYRADGLTLKAALHRDFSINLRERLVSACLCLEDGGGESYTPLQEAIVQGKTEWVRLPLRAKADPRARRKRQVTNDARSPIDRTAFQLAVEVNVQEITDMLLDEGVCVDEPAGTDNGITALQIAARDGRLGVAIRLRALGADVNARRALRDGLTALEAAAENGRIDLVHYLLDSGVLTTGKGRLQYFNAIMLARHCGHSQISTLLKGHRSWTKEDFDLLDETDILNGKWRAYHPDEYLDDEREEILEAIKALGPRRETLTNRIDESESDTSSEGDDGVDWEDLGPTGDTAPSHSTREMVPHTPAIDASVNQSNTYCSEAEIDWSTEFDDDAQRAGGSGVAFVPQPGQHMGSEEATHVLYDEAEMALATDIDFPLTGGFDPPLFSLEEWLVDFDEVGFPEEQF